MDQCPWLEWDGFLPIILAETPVSGGWDGPLNEERSKQNILPLGWLDQLQDFLFPRTRQSDAVGARRSRQGGDDGLTRILRKLLVGSVAIALLASFIGIFYYYSKSLARITEHPQVSNLASPTFAAKLNFGTSPDCGTNEGKAECWIGPEFDDKDWATVELPKFDIRALAGYRQALDKEFVYYRLRVPVPFKLQEMKETIAFSPSWINHKRFQIFLNGRQVYEGDGTTVKEALVTLPIPKADIRDGAVSFVIKATMSNADVGIRHHGGIYVGPKAVIDELHVSNERITVTYFLLILLSKGSVFVIFALFYFFTKGQRGFFDFLVYALCVTLENVFIMSEVLTDFNMRVSCYFLSKTIAIYALQRFFAHHYEVHRVRRKLFILGTLQLLGVLAMVVDHGWGSKTITVPDLLKATNFLLIGTLFGAVLIGLVNGRMYERMQVGKDMRRSLWEFVGFTSLYLVLLVWEVFFNEYRGTDMRAVFDLIFFYYMALVSARHTGFNEGKIVTLEAHMEEKRRMEVELQEAAEIAKAFLPDSIPQWNSFDIAVHHKPFTESSGDWFAFEQAPSGRLFHCVICDITGHGVQAAIIVSACKTVLSSMLASDPLALESPDFVERYARTLNFTLFSQGAGHHTATLLGLTFEPATETIRYLSAGHPPAMLMPCKSEPGKRPTALVSRNNVLGISADFTGKAQSQAFRSGDQVIAYTDGLPLVTHARVLGKFMAEHREAKDLQQLPKALYDAIWAVETEKTKKSPDDDVSIIWFRGAA